MTDMPFISVIVPHLNQPEGLRRCLTSLARQTYPADQFEIIVVDNGSSQMPAEVTRSFNRIRLIREDTPGPGPARNRGVTESSGDVLAFIDADCIAHSRWLEAAATALTRPGAAPVIGGDVRIAFRDARRLTALEAYESVFAYQQKTYIERKGFSGTGNLAFQRAVFEKVGPFAGIEVSEDRDWGRRARAIGLAITYVPDMIVFHPARNNLDELRRKWTRQQSHDFEDWRRAGRGSISWVIRALAVAASPLRDIPRTFLSRRIAGAEAKCRAVGVLIIIRWIRAAQMLRILIKRTEDRSALFWNRPDSLGGADRPSRRL